MCLAPTTINYAPGDHQAGDPLHKQVACRKCARCRDNRVNDLIGRALAEQIAATETFALTLTYSGDTAQSAVLRYADVQRMLWHLRSDGYSVRYICAGEYGTRKGRAHWHIVIWFYGKVPDVEIERRFDWKYWPHGFVYFQKPDFKGFRYILKYALKGDIDGGAVRHLAMSKRPPLGYSYFMELAEKYVDEGLAIHSPEYAFADIRNSKGAVRQFWLQGRMRELFLERYCALWREKYGKEPPSTEFILEGYLDKIARKEIELDPYNDERDVDARAAEATRREKSRRHEELSKLRWLIAVCSLSMDGKDSCAVFDDRTAIFWIKGKKWQVTEGNVSVADQVARLPLSPLRRAVLPLFIETAWTKPRPKFGV